MKISVIMSVYDERPQWLKESVESILTQTYKNIEFIIIVDNPEKRELIELLNEYVKKDDRVRLFMNERNMGLIFSLNRALSYAKGEYIARMDADDISHPVRLERQLLYIQEKQLDLIGANVNLFNDKGIFFTTDKLLTHKYLKKMLANGTIGIVHPTFFGRKDMFDRLNGYSPQALHTEDKDFLARVFCSGFLVGNTRDVLLDCRYNNQSITKTNAFHVQMIGDYITKMFRKCLRTGQYALEEGLESSMSSSERESKKYNLMQISLAEAREALNNKKYHIFMYKMIRSVIYNRYVLSTVKINILLKFFKILERIEMKLKHNKEKTNV